MERDAEHPSMQVTFSPALLQHEIMAGVFSSTPTPRLAVVRSILRAALAELQAKLVSEPFNRIVDSAFCAEVLKSAAFIHSQMDLRTSTSFISMILANLFKTCEQRLNLIETLKAAAEIEELKAVSQVFLSYDVLSTFMMPDLTATNVQLVLSLAELGQFSLGQILLAFAEKLGVKSLQAKHSTLEEFWTLLREAAKETFTLQDAINVMNQTCRLHVWTALAKTFAPELTSLSKSELQMKVNAEFRLREKAYVRRFNLSSSDSITLKFNPKNFENSVDFTDIILFKFFFPHKMIKEANEFVQEFSQKAGKELSRCETKPFELRYFAYQLSVYGLQSIISKEIKGEDCPEKIGAFVTKLKKAAELYNFEVEEAHTEEMSDANFKLELKSRDSTARALSMLKYSKVCLQKLSAFDTKFDYTQKLEQLEQIMKELKEIDHQSKSRLSQKRRLELRLQ